MKQTSKKELGFHELKEEAAFSLLVQKGGLRLFVMH